MKRAFTLIEILVVVAVISVLAALLIGVFSRVREKAHQATCQSNLKQIELAVQLYAQDNAGLYPYYFNAVDLIYPGHPNNKPGIGWAVRIGSYLKNNDLLQCPSDPTPGSNDPTQPPSPYYAGTPGYTDYGYNPSLGNISDARFAFPDRTVAFMDVITQPAWGVATNPTKPLGEFIRHSGGGNCAFVDGHVKWLKPTQIYILGRNSVEWPPCTIDASPGTTCAY